ARADCSGWERKHRAREGPAASRRAVGAGRLVQRQERERRYRHEVPLARGDQLDGAEGATEVIAELIDDLRGAQNRDGGWGAGRNRPSNTEATALAALALGRLRQPQLTTATQRGLAWLVACQRADGSWPLLPSLEAGSWATSLALICLSDDEHLRPQAQRGVEWLLGHRGRGLGFVASLLYRFSPESMPVR